MISARLPDKIRNRSRRVGNSTTSSYKSPSYVPSVAAVYPTSSTDIEVQHHLSMPRQSKRRACALQEPGILTEITVLGRFIAAVGCSDSSCLKITSQNSRRFGWHERDHARIDPPTIRSRMAACALPMSGTGYMQWQPGIDRNLTGSLCDGMPDTPPGRELGATGSRPCPPPSGYASPVVPGRGIRTAD